MGSSLVPYLSLLRLDSTRCHLQRLQMLQRRHPLLPLFDLLSYDYEQLCFLLLPCKQGSQHLWSDDLTDGARSILDGPLVCPGAKTTWNYAYLYDTPTTYGDQLR